VSDELTLASGSSLMPSLKVLIMALRKVRKSLSSLLAKSGPWRGLAMWKGGGRELKSSARRGVKRDGSPVEMLASNAWVLFDIIVDEGLLHRNDGRCAILFSGEMLLKNDQQ